MQRFFFGESYVMFEKFEKFCSGVQSIVHLNAQIQLCSIGLTLSALKVLGIWVIPFSVIIHMILYYCIITMMYDQPSSLPPLSRSCLACFRRRLFTTSVDPRQTAWDSGVTQAGRRGATVCFAALLGSAPLLRSKSAALSALTLHARNSGVTCGGGEGGWLTSLKLW